MSVPKSLSAVHCADISGALTLFQSGRLRFGCAPTATQMICLRFFVEQADSGVSAWRMRRHGTGMIES